MNENDTRKMRRTFDVDPDLYHTVRPRYPQALFDTLINATKLPDHAKLLEIGLGTGQATKPLAQHGYQITAVELGKNLAKFARRVLSKYKNVNIINDSFENVELSSESFDLIYAATAFHWINPEIKYKKTHHLLKSSGHLAVIGTVHVSDEAGDKFYHASQPLYEKYSPSKSDKDHRLPEASWVKPEKIDEELFSHQSFEKFPIQISYTADQYCKLLSSFSGTIQMSAKTRKQFLRDTAEIIETEFAGNVTKHSVFTLTLAKKI